MFNSNFNKFILIAFLGSSLIACSTIEHKSERIARKSLPSISSSTSITKYWFNSTDKGSKNQAIKLALANNEDYIFASDSVGNVRAVCKQTGRKIWQAKIKHSVTAGPSTNGKIVVLATEDGEIIALDSQSGNTVWRKKVSSEVIAAPLVTKDKVYVHALDGGIFALNVTTGKEIWEYSSITPPLMLRRSSSPVLAGKLLIVGTASGKLLAIDKNNGVLEWATDVSVPKGKSETQRMNDISSEAVVDDGKIYVVSYQGKLAAIDVATGGIVFDKDLSSFSGLSISNDKIYVATTEGDVYALDKATGHTIWQQIDLQGRWLTKPVVYKNSVLVGDDEGFLHLVSRENGELINRYKLDSSGIVAAPLVNDDRVFVLEQSGKFAALCIN